MKKKFLGRLLTMLLVAAMVFTLLPASAIAADWWGSADEYADDVSTQAATDVNYKIVHLDCGRKYFSKDWIIALLYEMQNDGYNQLQLAFGNDGLRFLLDDMSFTANGTEYSHKDVVSAVEAGNKAQNSSGDARWLTESEMEEIIATAKTLGIEIVPLLNLPGHANAILDIVNDKYNASGSNNTLDVANSAEAREFGKAIFAKYLDYFAGKGCKFFNFGADEYANDASGTFSFSRLNSTQYQAFVSFINDLAGMINEKSMTPRAFNDGLYYNDQKIDQSTYKNIQSIQCCYWSSGWGDYSVASASTIAGNGHEMINTNGDFYYVLGKSDKFDSDYSYARNFTNSGFMGSTISNSVGSMFCIWCDYPNAESETEVAKKTRLVLRAMALRMDNQSINSVSDGVVENGFNADGTIIVDYKQETVNVVLDQTKTVSVEGTLNKSGLDTSIAEVTVSGTNMTVTGKNVGDTSVIVGNTKYTIQVRNEDLATVKPLTIEYWITNAQVIGSTSKANSVTINAADNGVATEAGVSLTGIVDSTATKDSRTQEYWQAKMLDVIKENNSTSGTELQTTKNGDDETMSGTAFTKVRYYSGEWQVYTTEWVKVDRTQETFTYVGDNSTTVTYTGDRNQLVAYFMETVNIANANGKSELKANAADWGTKGDGTSSWGYPPESDRCSISIQIVYEDNTTNPASTAAADLKSKTIVYGYWSGGRGIGTMLFTGLDYQIYKVTAETGTMTSTTGTGNSVTVTSFKWADNEETVWEGDAQDSVSIGNPAKAPSYEAPYDNLAWNTSDHNKNNAILIRVYVKAPLTEDTLNVHYIDATNAEETEFYNYSINVIAPTVFSESFGLDRNGTLVGNTVKNANDVVQTVQTDLSEMPKISASYRYAAYECVDARRSDNGKDVYLYYKFSRTASFIADFGLPITISLGQINSELSTANVTGITVTTQQYGDVTTDVANKTFTYTPSKTFGKDIESLSVTVQGTNLKTATDGQITYQVYIIPASNVLYEENFLTHGSENSSTNVTRHTWSESKFDANKVQQTQKQNEAQIFGKDTAYEGITAAAGYWTVGNLNTSKDGTTSLTTNFFGNALDVIGSCGQNTGRVMITIKDAAGKAVQSVLVDTRYSAGSIDQVPLAHIELGDTDANYTAVIRGYARPSTSAQSASSPLRTYSYNSASYDALTADLAAMGLTMADVKVVSASEAAAKVASTQSAAQTYALNSTEITGATVTIDGFRVYRSADVEAYSSLDNEYKMTYKNILDVMDGKVITAYVDNTTVTDCSVNDYEAKGGPQNEIYLSKNQSVVFQIPGVDRIQVSLRAVNGTAKWNNKEITSNTEMYYTLLSSDTEGNFTIANSSENLLAIGNVKLPAGSSVVKTSALSKDTILASVRMALNAAPVDPEPEQPTVFVPEHFSIRDYATRFFRSKLVTLRIDFSKDVSYVEIDGRKYTPNKLASWFGYYTVTFTDTIGRNDDYFYKVVFFDANGNPSETQIVYGK